MKAQELIIGDVGVAVEEPALRTHTHGVNPQAHLPEHFLGIQMFLGIVKLCVLLLAQPVKFRHHWILDGLQGGEVRAVRNSPGCVELFQQDFQGIQLGIGEILVAAEKVFQKGNVLAQSGGFPEGLRPFLLLLGIVRPKLRLQGIDDIIA